MSNVAPAYEKQSNASIMEWNATQLLPTLLHLQARVGEFRMASKWEIGWRYRATPRKKKGTEGETQIRRKTTWSPPHGPSLRKQSHVSIMEEWKGPNQLLPAVPADTDRRVPNGIRMGDRIEVQKLEQNHGVRNSRKGNCIA